ncbi:MAG: hypothetical protein P4L33_11195 [Capsulimonadaceae bacterium]|nr:hypothetical protein [Capsulimonadaceae bacterium]
MITSQSMRRSVFVGAWLIALIALAQAGRAAAGQNVDLRGYGHVAASFAPGSAVFRCDSVAHADSVLGKLLADMFWDAGDAKRTDSLVIGGHNVPVHEWQPYGVVAAVRVGATVTVRGASTSSALSDALRSDSRFMAKDAVYLPQHEYPRYLDYYDLRSLKSYTGAMAALPETGLSSHWPFMKQFGIAGTTFQSLGYEFHNPAPGVVDWSAADYEVRQAEKEGGISVPAFVAGGPMPLWAYNEHPNCRMEPSPTSLIGSWGRVGTAGGSFESWGTTLNQRDQTSLAFMRAVMARYGSSPALGAWMPYGGSPGAEMAFHDRTDEYWDYSASGEQGFREWLRNVRGYRLADLSKRWYGDGARLTSWEDVHLPDVNGFYGNLDEKSFRLADGWKWMPAAESASVDPPAAVDPSWIPVAMPPSQQQAYLPWGPSYYRISFDPSNWAEANQASDKYLVVALNIRSKEGAHVWLNGADLGNVKPRRSGYGPIEVAVTKLLRPGVNDLVLRVPGSDSAEGKILGPVFLTAMEPRFYPYLGALRNAQYVDTIDWQVSGMARQNDQMFREMRAIDPNRPIVLSGGEIDKLGDVGADLASRYNLGVEMTGREAWYYPWNAGLGFLSGYYGTSEESATAHGTDLDREFGWIMFDGDSSHSFYYRLDDYIKRERETGWFTQHKSLLRLFGKALRERPGIVLFHSVATTRLGDETPMDWDIGRGEIQSAHYDYAYATERELAKGLANGYPVLFDCGSTVMDPSTLEAIRKYVEAGGVFVAMHNTGRHDTLVADSWPISSLTGFKVLASDAKGTVTFARDLPIMRGLEGRTFIGAGSAVNWQGVDSGKGVGLRLQPFVPEARALALWDDGSVAIGYRPLGKGRVIVLGSSFWRDGKDQSGIWLSRSDVERGFFDQLFGSLGVARTASADRPAIWTRKFVTKNGLQDWVIAYNSAKGAWTGEVAYACSAKPAEVWDMATKQGVPFSYSDGMVRIPQVAIDGYQVRVFGSRRADLASGLGVWWGEKVKYWQKRDGGDIGYVPPTTRQVGETLPVDTWRFLADRDGKLSQSDAWRLPEFPDSAWATIGRGPWNELDPGLHDYRGIGLYRAQINIPPSWSNRKVLLNLYSFDRPIAYDNAVFWINGKQAATYARRTWNQTYNYDVTALVHPGANIIAVQVTGGPEFSGLSGCVWLNPQGSLEQQVDLAGPWTVYDAAYKPGPSATLPGRLTGRYVAASCDIPEKWRGKSVYVRIRTPEQWLGSLVVNGRPIVYNQYLHPFGTISDINLTPYVFFGKTNRLELWPYSTTATPDGPKALARMPIDQVLLGCETRIDR